MTGRADNDLLQELRELETELHRSETRRDRHRLERLLHRDFFEIGRSGRWYDRAEMLAELAAGGEVGTVHARGFKAVELAPGTALLTYRSARVGSGGELQRCSLRSSLWVHTEAGWQIRFHQGTPTASFSA